MKGQTNVFIYNLKTTSIIVYNIKLKYVHIFVSNNLDRWPGSYKLHVVLKRKINLNVNNVRAD